MNFTALFEEYADDLWRLTERLRLKHLEFCNQGHVAAFGDVEGEILYLAVRELRPNCVFEISPGAGYSTNYLLAALTDNGHGRLHSFDHCERIHGRPLESVIRGNLLKGLDGDRLEIHVGDARDTTPQVEGPVQFCLLDSCHQEWFARWYIETLLPRINGWVMIQDICFRDRLECTAEARHVWQWLQQEQVRFELVGALEKKLRGGARPMLPVRRVSESNSILVPIPLQCQPAMPELAPNPEDVLIAAEQSLAKDSVKDTVFHLRKAETIVEDWPHRANLHRLLLRIADLHNGLGHTDLSMSFYRRALAEVMNKEGITRAKGLRELWRAAKSRHHWLKWFTGRHNWKPGTGRFPLAWTVLANVLCDRLSNRNAWKPRHTEED